MEPLIGHVAVHEVLQAHPQSHGGRGNAGRAMQGCEAKHVRGRHRSEGPPARDDHWQRARPFLSEMRVLRDPPCLWASRKLCRSTDTSGEASTSANQSGAAALGR